MVIDRDTSRVWSTRQLFGAYLFLFSNERPRLSEIIKPLDTSVWFPNSRQILAPPGTLRAKNACPLQG